MSQKIVKEVLKGDLDFKNEANGGCFYLSLPIII